MHIHHITWLVMFSHDLDIVEIEK